MPVWRLQVSIAADTAFAQDRMVITPHFDDSGVGTDPQGLCNDLRDACQGYFVGAREIEVKAYDAQGTVPVYPQGSAIVNTGLAPASGSQRETAICLSFYAGENRPRKRGRLYMPCCVMGIPTSNVRPLAAHQTKVAAFAPILQDLGGPDVDWVVYSRADDEARAVTNWWIDDAWDTVRSRGLDPATRVTGTTSEA